MFPAILDILKARLGQGYRTMAYPDGPAPVLPERFRGRPVFDPSKCAGEEGCSRCREACPTAAIASRDGRPSLDLGACLFCGECAEVCPTGAIRFTNDPRMATARRSDLVLSGQELARGSALRAELLDLFGRSLALRVVSAGSCGGCEPDTNVLTTVGWDLSRFGIDFVASPRHADGLFVVGAVNENMALALRKTYDAIAPPRLVIASGACALSGGPFAGFPAVRGGVESILPVDFFIPGCPPHPLTILDGFLRLVGRVRDGSRSL